MSKHPQVDPVRPYREIEGARSSLVVLADIARDEEAAFNEWYNREHMRDRVLEFSSFVRGRRYRAIEGSPKYLAIYDVTSSDVFSSPAYVSLVQQPDPRSQHFITRFQNAHRTIAQVDFSFGEGEGGALELWHMDAAAVRGDPRDLRDVAHAALSLPGAIAVQALSKDQNALAASSRAHVRQANRTFERALIIEAMDVASLGDIADVVTHKLGRIATSHGRFQLLYRVSP